MFLRASYKRAQAFRTGPAGFKWCLLMTLCISLLSGCYRKVTVPTIVVPEKPLGDGGITLRQFYRSFWEPPASDQEAISIGVVSAAPMVKFRSDHQITLRVYSERDSFEVESPKNTVWEVSATKLIRPAFVQYLPVVELQLFPQSKTVQSKSEDVWRSHGFSNARWIGPPQMDHPNRDYPLQRWVLSLVGPSSREESESLCKKARKLSGFCKVIAHTQLPALAQGVLRSPDFSFEKAFTGFVEIDARSKPIEVLEFIPEPRVQKTSNEFYSTPMYVIPTGADAVSLVQRTSLSNYLKAVVPSEIFASAHIEAVKAQAVVARTYMLRHLPEDAEAHPYGICASTLCQVYRGLSKRHPQTDKAVKATDSLVLWGDEGQPAETFYHGICAGRTEDKSVIWGKPARNYLKGVLDTKSSATHGLNDDDSVKKYIFGQNSSQFFCGSSTFTNPERWRWQTRLESSDLDDLLKKLELTPPLTRIQILKRGPSGRALSVLFSTPKKSVTVNGELKIRMLMGGLLSSLMWLEPEKRGTSMVALSIHGAGYGHGVGMCQVGAIGRAEHGQKFEEILGAYYPGTSLATIMLK